MDPLSGSIGYGITLQSNLLDVNVCRPGYAFWTSFRVAISRSCFLNQITMTSLKTLFIEFTLTSSQKCPGSSSSSSLLYPWSIVDLRHQMETIEGFDHLYAFDFSSKRLCSNEVIFTMEVDRLLVFDADQRLLEDFFCSWRACRPEVTNRTKKIQKQHLPQSQLKYLIGKLKIVDLQVHDDDQQHSPKIVLDLKAPRQCRFNTFNEDNKKVFSPQRKHVVTANYSFNHDEAPRLGA